MNLQSRMANSALVGVLTLLASPAFLLLAGHFIAPLVPQVSHWTGTYVCQFDIVETLAPYECGSQTPFAALKIGCLLTLGVILSYCGLILLISGYCGPRVRALRLFFPFSVRLSLFVSPIFVGLVLTNWSLFAFSLFNIPLAYLPFGQTIINVGLGVMALLTLIMMAATALSGLSKYDEPADHLASCIALSWDDAPELWQIIKKVSEELQIRMPRQVIIGWDYTAWIADRTFYTDVEDRIFNGPTLYLSMPLLRILSVSELTAIISHEMAHFSGGDVHDLKKYSRLYDHIEASVIDMDELAEDSKAEDEESSFITMSYDMHKQTFRFLLNVFVRNMRAASRKRELVADKTAAAVTSPTDICTSLIKLGAFGHIWEMVVNAYIKGFEQGHMEPIDISQSFAEAANLMMDGKRVSSELKTMGRQVVPHPFDTHPPTKIRLKKLKFKASSDEVKNALVIDPDVAADSLLADPAEIFAAIDPAKTQPAVGPSTARNDVASALSSLLYPIINNAVNRSMRAEKAVLDLLKSQPDFQLLQLVGTMSNRLSHRNLDNALDVLAQRLTKPQRKALLRSLAKLAKEGASNDASAQKALTAQAKASLR